jgi:hypothetical protein
MDIFVDGSQKGLEKLEALIKSGQLKEISGIPIQYIESEVSNSLLSQTLVNLEQWLQNIIDASWQTVKDVLGEETGKLVVARSAVSTEGVLRAQRIDLEIESTVTSLALVVSIQPTSSEERDIRLAVYSIDSTTLPIGLKFIVLDTSGKILKEDEAKKADKLFQLKISGKTGECFSLRIELANANTSWSFII